MCKRGRWRRWILIVLTGLAPVVAATELTPCQLPGVEGEARCGRYSVLERADRPDGRRIELKLVLLPATGTAAEKAADAITFLAGGGVMPATRYAPFLARVLAEQRRHRDIVLVDQRGTGESNPLHCQLPSPIFDAEAYADRNRYLHSVRACISGLAAKADLTAYHTEAAMRDLEAVREALGYPQWSIWGVSYGTKAARVYLRLFPQQVRVAVLYGVVPLAFPMWPDLPQADRRMLQTVLQRCAEDADCNRRFPELPQRLAALVDKLDSEPYQFIAASDQAQGRIDGAALLQLLSARLSTTRESALLPQLIDAVEGGEMEALTGGLDRSPPPVPAGVYYSIACSEERALWQPSDGGHDWLDRERDTCSLWPRSAIDESYWQPLQSDRPVVLVSGADDHITPPAYAARIAVGLSHARLLEVPNAGHGDVNPCIVSLIAQTIEAGDHRTLDTACLATLPDYGFPPAARSL